MSLSSAGRSPQASGAQVAQGAQASSAAQGLSFEDGERPQPLPLVAAASNLFEKHAEALRTGTGNVSLMSLSTLAQADFREPRNRALFYLAGGHQSLKHLLTQNRLADMGSAPQRVTASLVAEALKLIRKLVCQDSLSRLLFAGPLDQSAEQYNALASEGFSKIDIQAFSFVSMNAGIPLYLSVLFNRQSPLENRVTSADILCQIFRCRENRWTLSQMDPGWAGMQLVGLLGDLAGRLFAGTSATLYYQPAQDVRPETVDLLEAVLRIFATMCMSPRLCTDFKRLDLIRILCRLMYYPDLRIYELSLVVLSTAASYGGGGDEGVSSAVLRRPSPDLDLLGLLTQSPQVVERMCSLITPRSSNLYLRGSSTLLALLANVPGGDLAVTRCGGIQPLINMLSVDDSNILYAACQVICGISQRVSAATQRASGAAMDGPKVNPSAGIVMVGATPEDIAISSIPAERPEGGAAALPGAPARQRAAEGDVGAAASTGGFGLADSPDLPAAGAAGASRAAMEAEDLGSPESNVFTVNHMIIDELVTRKAIPEIVRLLERCKEENDLSDSEGAQAGARPAEPKAGQSPFKEHIVGVQGVYSSFSCLTSWLLHALANVLPSQLAPPYLKRGSGVLELLCSFTKSCNPCIVHWACQCLANSCRHQDVARASNQEDIVGILLSLVNRITRDEEFEQQYGMMSASLIVAAACECLSCQLQDQKLAARTGTSVNNAHYILVRALRVIPNGRTRAWVCGAIAGLCEVSENTRVFLEHHIVEHLSYLCVEAGQLIQAVDLCLREQVCLAISAICRTAPLRPVRGGEDERGRLAEGSCGGDRQGHARGAVRDLLRDPLTGNPPAALQLRPFSNLSNVSGRAQSQSETDPGDGPAGVSGGVSASVLGGGQDGESPAATALRDVREKYGERYGEASVSAEFGRRGVVGSISSFLVPTGLAVGREGVSYQELCCQRAAASAANALTAVGRNAILFYKEGCVEKLLYLMGHGDRRTRTSAAGAIRNVRKALYELARNSTGSFQLCQGPREGAGEGASAAVLRQQSAGAKARRGRPRYLGCFTVGRHDLEAAARVQVGSEDESDVEAVEIAAGGLQALAGSRPGSPDDLEVGAHVFRPSVAIETLGSNSGRNSERVSERTSERTSERNSVAHSSSAAVLPPLPEGEATGSRGNQAPPAAPPAPEQPGAARRRAPPQVRRGAPSGKR